MLRVVAGFFIVIGALCTGWGLLSTAAGIALGLREGWPFFNIVTLTSTKLVVDVGVFGVLPLLLGLGLRAIGRPKEQEPSPEVPTPRIKDPFSSDAWSVVSEPAQPPFDGLYHTLIGLDTAGDSAIALRATSWGNQMVLEPGGGPYHMGPETLLGISTDGGEAELWTATAQGVRSLHLVILKHERLLYKLYGSKTLTIAVPSGPTLSFDLAGYRAAFEEWQERAG